MSGMKIYYIYKIKIKKIIKINKKKRNMWT